MPKAKSPIGLFPQGLASRRTRREILTRRLLVICRPHLWKWGTSCTRYIYNTSISGFCAAIVAQAQPFSVFCLRANIFGSVPLLVSAIRLHGKSQRADWHTVISNGISLILKLSIIVDTFFTRNSLYATALRES